MLSRLSIESAVELNNLIRQRGQVLSPIPDTPVDDMVEATEPVVEEVPQEQPAIMDALEESTVVPLEVSPVTHDAIINNVTERVAELTIRRINLIRTILNPLIKDYTGLIVQGLSDSIPSDATIIPIELGDFYRNHVVEELFAQHHYDGLEPLRSIGGFDQEYNPLPAMTTGSKIIDDKLATLTAQYGESFIYDVYSKYFVNKNDLSIPYIGINNEYIRSIDEALVVYFLARHFYNNGEEVLSYHYRSDGSGYRIHLLKLMNRAAQIVKSAFEVQSGWETSDTLVGQVTKESIYVFKGNYDKYKQAGGSDYAIRGHILRKGYRTTSVILNNQKSLEDAYQNDVESEIRARRISKIEAIRRVAMIKLPIVIDTIPDDVLNSIPEFAYPREEQLKLLNKRGLEYISSIYIPDETDIEGFAIGVISEGLLPELRLKDFYAKMDAYLKPSNNNGLMSKSKAAYFVIIEELADFFLSQVSTSTLGK